MHDQPYRLGALAAQGKEELLPELPDLLQVVQEVVQNFSGLHATDCLVDTSESCWGTARTPCLRNGKTLSSRREYIALVEVRRGTPGQAIQLDRNVGLLDVAKRMLRSVLSSARVNFAQKSI